MTTVLYNSQTKHLSKFFRDGYNVPIPKHEQSYIFVLDVIEPDRPSYNPITQKITCKWVNDLEAKQYRKEWTVENKTPYELAMQDWHEPAYPLRIKAGVEILNPLHPQAVQIHMFYNYLKAQGLPEYTEGGVKYVYVNDIQPEHQDFFDMLIEVESEKRPEPADYE